GDVNNGLIVESYGDRIVVKALDFFADEQIREVTIRNPLTPYAADIVPVSERPADYSTVDEALAAVPADLSPFTADTVAALNRAVSAVERELTAADQAGVDAMAAAIRAGIDGLVRIDGEGPGSDPGADPGAGAGSGSGSGSDAVTADGDLATTGYDPGVTWIIALGLLGLGGAIVLGRRLAARRASPDAAESALL
ncbi:hypothetical protein J7E68_11095, partial [Microbacterium sp. ISL-103]|nr:hypothetical protein [Microbacterium sp. ISL-103]